ACDARSVSRTLIDSVCKHLIILEVQKIKRNRNRRPDKAFMPPSGNVLLQLPDGATLIRPTNKRPTSTSKKGRRCASQK
ncbi:hypothetical protein, partial [Salmonella enterica]